MNAHRYLPTGITSTAHRKTDNKHKQDTLIALWPRDGRGNLVALTFEQFIEFWENNEEELLRFSGDNNRKLSTNIQVRYAIGGEPPPSKNRSGLIDAGRLRRV
jgi:hypothetical protein